MSTLRRICYALSLAIVHFSSFFASEAIRIRIARRNAMVKTLKLVAEAEVMHYHSSFEMNISTSLVEDLATTPCHIERVTDWTKYLRNRLQVPWLYPLPGWNPIFPVPPTTRGPTNVVAQIMDPRGPRPYGGTVFHPEMHYVHNDAKGGSMIALSWVYTNTDEPGSYVIIVLLFDATEEAVVRNWGDSVFAPDFFKFSKWGKVDGEGRNTVLDIVQVAMELEGEAIHAPSIIKGYTLATVTLQKQGKPCQDIHMTVIEVTAEYRGKGLAKSLVRLLLHKLERNSDTWKLANPEYDERQIRIGGEVADNPNAAAFWTSILGEDMKRGAKVSQIPLSQVQEKVSRSWPVN